MWYSGIHLINGKRRKCKKMNETVTPLLNAIVNQAKKNDAKLKSQKHMPNGNHLLEMNQNNDQMQPKPMQQAVNEHPLVDYCKFFT